MIVKKAKNLPVGTVSLVHFHEPLQNQSESIVTLSSASCNHNDVINTCHITVNSDVMFMCS